MKRVLGLILLSLLGQCNRPPQFVMQGYFFVGAADEATAQRENPTLLKAVEEVVTAIVSQNPAALLGYVNAKEGAVIDAKAFATFAQIQTALYDSSSQLSRVLWDDKYWKETAPRDNIRSYRTSFSRAGEIKVALFWYSPTECEARLDFKDRPAMGIMGNIIFRKRGERWYLMNFF